MTESGGTPRKQGKPFLRVKHGSAVVPIYRGMVRKWLRYTISFHLNGRRVRRTFGSLEKAKEEARIVARRIQEGLASTNDLRPQERESLLAANKMLAARELPLLPVLEEYLKCRDRLGDVPLMTAVEDFAKRISGIEMGRTTGQVLEELLQAKAEDGASKRYVYQLRQTLSRLVEAFPGPILEVRTNQIDQWLRALAVGAVTRNNTMRLVKTFFSFAKSRSYLPKSEPTAAEFLVKAKEPEATTCIFRPAELEKLLTAAPAHLVPIYAIGGFAGLRAAELGRLHWNAVSLERKIIELRAGQAKTASRRIVPISDNLVKWLEALPRDGMVVPDSDRFRQATALAKKIGLSWPNNVLRHSFISYRLAEVQNAHQVALEAGNSPAIIFKHYRELVSNEDAKKWFEIMPPDGWQPSQRQWCRQKRRFV